MDLLLLNQCPGDLHTHRIILPIEAMNTGIIGLQETDADQHDNDTRATNGRIDLVAKIPSRLRAADVDEYSLGANTHGKRPGQRPRPVPGIVSAIRDEHAVPGLRRRYHRWPRQGRHPGKHTVDIRHAVNAQGLPIRQRTQIWRTLVHTWHARAIHEHWHNSLADAQCLAYCVA